MDILNYSTSITFIAVIVCSAFINWLLPMQNKPIRRKEWTVNRSKFLETLEQNNKKFWMFR